MAGKIVIDIEDLATQTLEGLDEALKHLQTEGAAPLEKALGEVEQAQNAVAESAEELSGQVTEAAGEVEELAEQLDGLQDGMEKAEKSTGDMVSGLSEVEKAAKNAGQQVKQFGADQAKQAATAGEQFTAMGRRASGFAQSVAVMVASNEDDLQRMMQSIIRVRATFQMFDDGLAAVRRLSAGIAMLQQTKQNLAAITPAVVAANQAHAASNVAVAGTAGTATGAVKMLTAAMLANPVTAVLVGLAAAVTGVVAAFMYFNRASKEADEQAGELSKSFNEVADAFLNARMRALDYSRAIREAVMAGDAIRSNVQEQIADEQRLAAVRHTAMEALSTASAYSERDVRISQNRVAEAERLLSSARENMAISEAHAQNEELSAAERQTWLQRQVEWRERIIEQERKLQSLQQDANREATHHAAIMRELATRKERIAEYDAEQTRQAQLTAFQQMENLQLVEREVAARRKAVEEAKHSHGVDSDAFKHAQEAMKAIESQRERLIEQARREAEELSKVRDAMSAMRGDFEDFAAERLRQQEERARQEDMARAVEGERLDELYAKEQDRLKASKDLQKELAKQQQELRQLKQAAGDVKDIEEQRQELAERIKQTKAGIVEQDRRALEYQRAQEKIEQDRQRRADQEAQKRQAALTREIQQRQILQQLAAQMERKDVAQQIAQQRIAAGDMPDRIAGMGGAQQERAMMQMVMAQLKAGVVPQEEIARAQLSAIEQGARQIGLNEEQLKAFREAVGIEQQQFKELQMIREALEPLQEWIKGERRPKPGRAQAGAGQAAGPEGVPMADPQAAVRGAGEAFQREIEQRARLADATGQLAQQQVEYAQRSASMLERTTGLLGNNTAMLGRTAERLARVEQTLEEITRSQRRNAQIAGRT